MMSCSISAGQKSRTVADRTCPALITPDRAWYHTCNSVLLAANLDDGSFFLSRLVSIYLSISRGIKKSIYLSISRDIKVQSIKVAIQLHLFPWSPRYCTCFHGHHVIRRLVYSWRASSVQTTWRKVVSGRFIIILYFYVNEKSLQ